MVRVWLVAFLLIGLSVAGAGTLGLSRAAGPTPAVAATATALPTPTETPVPQPTRTSGTEAPREGCLFENGFNICAWGDANLKDFYLRYRNLLGEPVASFDSRCQAFRFSSVCYNPGNPEGWKLEFANLGLADLLANGFSPQPGAELHPALREWILSQMDLGIDTTRVVGRVISQPVCDRTTNRCRIWADKQLFVVPKDALSEAEVQRAPLGLWSVRQPAPIAVPPTPQPAPTTQPTAVAAVAPSHEVVNSTPWSIAVGIALALVGVVGLLLSGRTGSRSGSVTI